MTLRGFGSYLPTAVRLAKWERTDSRNRPKKSICQKNEAPPMNWEIKIFIHLYLKFFTRFVYSGLFPSFIISGERPTHPYF